jgi:hypothetical protein
MAKRTNLTHDHKGPYKETGRTVGQALGKYRSRAKHEHHSAAINNRTR